MMRWRMAAVPRADGRRSVESPESDLEVDSSMSGKTVSVALDRVLASGPAPRSITADHGTEFMSRALEDWAFPRVQLDFIRQGKPVEMPVSRPSTGGSATSA